MQLKIEQLPIGDLKPYENNAKLHTDEQIQQIKNSIEAFGMNDPIGVWGEDNTIVEGHGRLIACMELGMETVPVIRLDNMTDEQRKAYTLVHNQTTMNTDFDYNILGAELAEIDEFHMEDFGFIENDINVDDFDTDFTLAADDKPKVRTITLTLSEKQFEIVTESIDFVKDQVEIKGGCNENGAAVYEIVKEWSGEN